jgi:molybdopterin/thiamine biosynthesis adenylyltransferase
MNWDRVERKLGAHNLALLATRRVGIIGLGSGGGFVAQALAMSGVGSFVLVDDDVVESSNLVRHVAGAGAVGRHKAQVLAEMIRERNPAAQVDARVGRIEAHMGALEHLDLLVVAVDGEGAKYVINQACLAHHLTAVYAGVYERGEGGDACIIRPYEGPCYACWAAELREGLIDPRADEELDYGMINAEGTLDAEPGLWLDVVRVAAAQGDMALNWLLRGTPVEKPLPANTVVIANTLLEITEGEQTLPYGAVWVNIERDPDCLVCGSAARAGRLQDALPSQSLDDLLHDSGLTLEEEKST